MIISIKLGAHHKKQKRRWCAVRSRLVVPTVILGATDSVDDISNNIHEGAPAKFAIEKLTNHIPPVCTI